MAQPSQDLGTDPVDQRTVVFGGTGGQCLDDPVQPAKHRSGAGPFSFDQHLMKRPQIIPQCCPGFRLIGGTFQFCGDGLL